MSKSNRNTLKSKLHNLEKLIIIYHKKYNKYLTMRNLICIMRSCLGTGKINTTYFAK